MSDKVLIFDTSLRDGEQSPGVAFNISDKLEIAHQLQRLGVDVIEAGFPASSPGDFEAVKAVAKEVRESRIAGLARAVQRDVDACAEAVKEAASPRIHVFLSTSDIHLMHQLAKDRDTVREMARTMVARAKGYVEDVEFSPMDATRSEWEYVYRMLEDVIEAGATTVNIPDTVGYTTPGGVPRLHQRHLRERAQHPPVDDLGALPQRPRPRRGEQPIGGTSRGAPGRDLHQRHRRAGRQRGRSKRWSWRSRRGATSSTSRRT